MVFVELQSIFLKHLISVVSILFSRSAVKVDDSKAQKKIEVTWKSLSLIFELVVMFLSFQVGLTLVSAAVVRAILERISGLEPSGI